MKDAVTAVLYDLDSTLADTRDRWRLSPVSDPESSWEQYAAACMSDIPVPGLRRAMELHWRQHQNHVCSVRPDTAMSQTHRWLQVHGFMVDQLYLAPSAPHFPDRDAAVRHCADVKIAYMAGLEARGITPVLFYEDQPDIARIIHAETGVPVVIVNPAYPVPSQEWREENTGGHE